MMLVTWQQTQPHTSFSCSRNPSGSNLNAFIDWSGQCVCVCVKEVQHDSAADVLSIAGNYPAQR